MFNKVVDDLTRYNPDWERGMHVADLATWLGNWEGEHLLAIYVSCQVERRATRCMHDLARAAKLSIASYVAMDAPIARLAHFDEGVKADIDARVRARTEDEL